MLLCIGPGAHSSAHQDQPAPNSPATSGNNPAPGDQTQSPTSPSPTDVQPQTAPPPQAEAQHQNPAPQKSKPAVKKRKPIKKKPASSQSERVVVRNGGTKDNSEQLTPALSPEQELHSRENTAELLATTDSNLKKVTAQELSAAQQGMLNQIHTYVRQSKAASDSGDLTRAHTLAYKAHLLSDELAGK